MVGYYEINKSIYDHLLADEDINTVVIGSLDKVDINKKTLFPLAHVMVSGVTLRGGLYRFSVTVSVMDIVDIVKDNLPKNEEAWKGLNNEQDISNTMLTVLEGLYRAIDKGNMYDLGYELQGDFSADPFEDRFDNLLTGWSSTFSIDVPNVKQNC